MSEQLTLEKAGARVSGYAELGVSGLQRSGGFVNEEFLPVLRGFRARRVYREMSENDALIGSILFAIDKLIRNVKWKPDGEDEETVEFVQQCMDDMTHTWADFVSEVMTMLPHGWSWFETVYKRREGEKNDGSRSKFTDGRIGWRKFGPRAQTSMLRWEFDDNGGLKGMWQSAAPKYEPVFIPIEKSLLFRTSTHSGNPEGKSVLRTAYRSWYFKKRIEEIEAIGIERDLAGLPVLYMDPSLMDASATPEQKAVYDEYKKIIRNIRRDEQEGVVLPSIFDQNNNKLISLELLSSGGARSFDTGAIIERYNKAMAMSVLADFILLGHEAVGSFALSADKTDLFAVALGAWLQSIAGVLNEYALPRLFKLNGITDTDVKIVPGDIEDMPLEVIVNSLNTLSTIGMPVFPHDELQDMLYERMKLPKVTDEVRAAAKPAPAPEKNAPEPTVEAGKAPKGEQ